MGRKDGEDFSFRKCFWVPGPISLLLPTKPGHPRVSKLYYYSGRDWVSGLILESVCVNTHI